MSQVAQQLKSFLILFSSNRKIMLFLSFIILLLLGWVLGKLATQFLDDSSSPVLQAKNVVFNASVA